MRKEIKGRMVGEESEKIEEEEIENEWSEEEKSARKVM